MIMICNNDTTGTAGSRYTKFATTTTTTIIITNNTTNSLSIIKI